MTITLHNTGKRFNRDWIFRKLSYTFHAATSYAITGSNGSGKSTLMQIIAGSMDVSEGSIEWAIDGKSLTEDIFKHISIVAPYLEVIEEMTATEFLRFHSSFKPLLENIEIKEILEIIGLTNAANKQIRYYSSGMKQRIKLAQAVFANVPVLLLDEPCTNFDSAGYELYYRLITDYCINKIIIVSSNDTNEFNFCKERISMLDFR